jgi:stearoyl-CoA 9-desaturase NADPH oxidoreductase
MSPTATTIAPSRPRGFRAQRLLDAIAGPHGLDRYLEQINPTFVIGKCRAEVIAVEHGTEDSVTLSLRPNRAWKGLRAGQFVQVSAEIDGVRHSRCYSPASPEDCGRELEITVKRHPNGLVSNFLTDHARPGMVLGLSQAEGDFHLPDTRPDSILLIGGGSGITPLMAILRTLCGEKHPGKIALIQYAPEPGRTIYREELDRLAAENPNFTLARSYTRAPGAGDLDGHFSPAHLPQVDPDFTAAETFACGPPALLDAVRGTWAHGLEQRLHVESFVPPSLLPVGEPGTGTIRFADSDLEIENSGASILEQAEQAGVPAESGCRMGICHTCTCRKQSGTVKNLLTGEVSTAADEEIQLCVSAPLSDLVIDL